MHSWFGLAQSRKGSRAATVAEPQGSLILYDEEKRMAEVVKSRWIRGALVAFGVMALCFGTARVSAAQTIDQRLRASRQSVGGGEGFVDPSGRAFTFCRVAYRQVRREPMGQGWRTDYPDADRNLMLRLSQLTTTPIRTTPQGRPDHLIVQLTDDEIFQCPFVFMSDVGTMALDSVCGRNYSGGHAGRLPHRYLHTIIRCDTGI